LINWLAEATFQFGHKPVVADNAVADHIVSQLKQYGDPWKPSEEANPTLGPTI
jgi:hypothetical protein